MLVTDRDEYVPRPEPSTYPEILMFLQGILIMSIDSKSKHLTTGKAQKYRPNG